MSATIFAVDDDPVFLRILTRSLSDAGHEVVTTEDSREALRRIDEHDPDVIVLDIVMPEVTGWELLAALRDGPRSRSTPVIVLSALGDPADRVRGMRAGADDYLVKPIDHAELLVRIEMQLARAARDSSNLDRPLGRREGGLHGSLDAHPMHEVLQILEQNDKTGELTIGSGALTGKIRLRQGRLVDAELADAHVAGYRGPAAVRAILELTTGRFRFLARDVPASPGEEVTSFVPFLMEHAWVNDMLVARGESLPPADAPLKLSGRHGTIEPAYDTLPIAEVARYLLAHPGSDRRSVLEQRFDSPQRVELALVWLREKGLLEMPGPGRVSSGEIRLDLERVLHAFADDAERRGFERGDLRILVLAEAQAWESLAFFLAEIPDPVLGAGGRVVVDRICVSQSGEVELASGGERLRWSFATLGLDPIPGWVAEACALVIWRGGHDFKLKTLAAMLAGRARPEARLLMLAPDGETSPAPERWHGYSARDPGLRDLLAKLARLDG